MMGKLGDYLDDLINSAEEALSGKETRAEKREKVDDALSFWIMSGMFVSRADKNTTRAGRIKELGQKSMLFQTKEQLSKGSEISFLIGEEKAPKIIRGNAKVFSAKKMSGGIYHIEADFISYDEEVRGKEHRLYNRYQADVPVEINLYGEKKSCLARVEDISKGGMKLSVSREFYKGDILRIKMFAPGSATKIIIKIAEVMRVSQVQKKYLLGIKFISEKKAEEKHNE